MAEDRACWVIRSVRDDGKRFRPSDWIERLSSSFAQYGVDRRLRYDQRVHPGMVNGERCLVVDSSLAEQRPDLYEYILAFAQSNRLQSDRVSCGQTAAA